jgi:PAS domain S-box-containing protein
VTIDIGTLSFIVGIVDILQVLAFLLQYLINRTYRGIGLWALGSALAAAGFMLFMLREAAPQSPVLIVCANTLLVLGPAFIYIGVMRFFERKANRGFLLPLLAVFLISFSYFAFVRDSIAARTVIISFTSAAISFLLAYSLFARRTHTVRASAHFIAAVVLAHGCFFAYRAVMTLAITPAGGFYSPTAMQAATFMAALAEGILLTLGLIVMINQRLNADSREAKEHFELLFNTSPDAVLISRLRDGMVVQINDGFTRQIGYVRGDIIGKTAIDIGLWADPADRARFADELGRNGFCENLEAVFRRKDGSRLIGMLSARRFLLQGTPHIISVTRDITRRKIAEEALEEERRRLQKALDEVKSLRGIIPICASCKKIRDDTGYWSQVEQYIADHSEAEFSHGICPECMKKLYPGLVRGGSGEGA